MYDPIFSQKLPACLTSWLATEEQKNLKGTVLSQWREAAKKLQVHQWICCTGIMILLQ